ncbi:MAG: thiamine-monophosphate kinase [Candidatus Thermoplasmatota archaeon]|jgi:thiamine-monophosphate kinase|nr:thiamine-monophosphate kinase [Candidatus Thermoplasmatota archaeon]MCL5988290.1 thiamine-monophosphate kinase [Candidatus Thermoplasmatota archaeon]
MDGKCLLFTMDSITLDTHIPKGASPFNAGYFFASLNLSDVAAMAGKPTAFMASFVIREDLESSYISEFVKGISSVLSRYGVDYIGGDTKKGSDNVFTGFCMGIQTPELTRRRSDIRPDQVVCVTNSLGRVGAAYTHYTNGVDLDNASEIIRVEPRINEAISISEAGGKFMMDISDGLFGCISQMKEDYGIGFRLVSNEIPLDPSVYKASERYGLLPLDIGCNIGGDYELLFTIDNENYGDFSAKMKELGISVSYIGTTWSGANMMFDGEMWNEIHGKGWDNFLEIK